MKNQSEISFAFWGTPEVASGTLEILKNSGILPKIIITSPDRRSGRGMHLIPTPVSVWAEKNNIKCLKPEKIDDKFMEELFQPPVGLVGTHQSDWWPDLSVVVAYGKILPEAIIKAPKLGTINIHYSLLPKYRGASPVEQAILNGDTETGVCIQQMEFKLDSGPIIAQEKVDIDKDEMKIELLHRLIKIGGELLLKNLPDIFDHKTKNVAQDETLASFCKKIKKEDGQIDPSGDPKENYNKYRAFLGWPGVYFFKNNKRYKITKAKYENDSFTIERVIPEGKKEIDYQQLLKSNASK